ncbi:adenosylcobinamide-phosphate synthase CbiB [Kamptonema sp. UHCC 0994]|uniref:adenosylcobinamide-phosphate synthase CbiB n=1 Tax=Kamptonema sp. UHCC 0994 TaxID=3031329 RepID=UPI0023BA4728|nr:adenosylcobinamide-phosphate synthase CbiB [Kamptonema sp. UHCC 0994]MDF0556274.1 adenosylcobinamide-phosphate synthase CbiB [Kamptonema sp. UHCC 0994]
MLVSDAVPAAVLLLAAILDYLIGDPWGWPHPVRVMGWLIDRYTQVVFNIWNNPTDKMSVRSLRLVGSIGAIALVIGSGYLVWLAVQVANWVDPILAIALESILLASCFAGRSLRAAAEDVLHPLNSGDLVKARERLSFYVGRDTENLSGSEILRAVLETVTENAVDGVMAPLFYGVVGVVASQILLSVSGGMFSADGGWLCLGVSFAIAYKAASTLDSMVGYKEAPYTDLGWFSAKLDDVLTWLPCRLTVITLALISGKPCYIWRICQRDAIKDASPNSGWSECAYAATLGVQVGGTNSYRGMLKDKPFLGEPIHPITPEKINQALQLTRYCFLIWLGLSFLLYTFFFVF